MTWEKIFSLLAKEQTVHVSAEAVINTKLTAKIGDVLIYDLELQYLSKDGIHEETVRTLDELKAIVEREPAYVKCKACGELVNYSEGYWIDNERGLDYCCFDCLLKELRRVYGEDKVRVLAYKYDDECDDIELLEELYSAFKTGLKNKPVMLFNRMVFNSESSDYDIEQWIKKYGSEKSRTEIPFPNNDIIKALSESFRIMVEIAEVTEDTEASETSGTSETSGIQWREYDIDFVQKA